MEEQIENPWADGSAVLPGWVLKTCYWISQLLFPLTFVVIFSWLDPYLPESQLADFVVAVPLALAMLWLSVGVHEAGHAVAARIAGMTVLQVFWWPFESVWLRRGVRLRMAAPMMGRLGLVFSIPPVGMRVGGPQLCLLAGGAVANALACALAMSAAWYFRGEAPAAWFGAFGCLNAYLVLSNLLPYDHGGPNDGLQILRILARRAGQDRLDPVTESFARSVAGETANQIPEALVAQVATLGPQGQMLAVCIRLKAAQQRGDWQEAVAQGEEQARIEATLPDPIRKALQRLSGLLRQELAFSRALLERDLLFPVGLPRDRDVAWLCPHLRPRHAALAAALRGDAALMERELQRARGYAETSRELSVAASEAQLAEHLRALCAQVQADQPVNRASA